MLRYSLLMRKVGCTRLFNHQTFSYEAATLLQLEENAILSMSNGGNNIRVALVGFGDIDANKLNKAQRVFYSKVNVKCKRRMVELKFDANACKELKVSDSLSVDCFKVGQYIDVSGYSIGKGFAGVMKRHNFRGLRKTHGVSISHRSHGSIGQCQDPGKVAKGKKMAGQLGNKKVTVQNLRILGVDANSGLLAVGGSVPGAKTSYVFLRHAIKKYIM